MRESITDFTYEIIEKNIDELDLDIREKFWIKYYNTLIPNGYNMTLGG